MVLAFIPYYFGLLEIEAVIFSICILKKGFIGGRSLMQDLQETTLRGRSIFVEREAGTRFKWIASTCCDDIGRTGISILRAI